MYEPAAFAVDDPDALRALIRARPLGTWVTVGGDGAPVVDHVPFLLDEGSGDGSGRPLRLLAHVARANPVWRSLPAASAAHAASNGAADGAPTIVAFHGPQAYVSPSWYASKRSGGGKVVPTWNYAVVHAHGRARAVDDPVWLRDVIGRLTDANEAGFAHPWRVADAPDDFVAQLTGAIVGIEIVVERLVGKWKVSQNRPEADRHGVVAGLGGLDRPAAPDGVGRAEDDDAMASLVAAPPAQARR